MDVALTTVDLVLGGEQAAYGLCRPPGHHAARAMYGGYCFFNNAAIAAHAITQATGERVSIIDVDYHHGNGSQQIFWRRGDVRYISIHADPERQYPYFLGRADETGEGDGAGENLNIPLRAGATNEDYLAATDRAVEAILAVPGSVVVVSLGFDTYGLDPIGDFALTTDVYHEVGRRVAATGRRLVILQEGGYHRPSLGENARAWLRGAEGRPFEPLPASRVHRGRFGRRVTPIGVRIRPQEPGEHEREAVHAVVEAAFADVTVADLVDALQADEAGRLGASLVAVDERDQVDRSRPAVAVVAGCAIPPARGPRAQPAGRRAASTGRGDRWRPGPGRDRGRRRARRTAALPGGLAALLPALRVRAGRSARVHPAVGPDPRRRRSRSSSSRAGSRG